MDISQISMGGSCSVHQRHQQYYEQPFRPNDHHQVSNRRHRRRRRRNRNRIRTAASGDLNSSHMRNFNLFLGNGDAKMMRLGGFDRKNLGQSRGSGGSSSIKHSVILVVPDDSIVALYPPEENYFKVSCNRRSPKSLSELACDAVCRSLVHLHGALPNGLPQDVVDDILKSLLRHSALSETTLRTLKNCELHTLSFVNSRGFSDEWLKPLSASKSSYTLYESSITDKNFEKKALVQSMLRSLPAIAQIVPTQKNENVMMHRGWKFSMTEENEDIRSMDFEEFKSDDDTAKGNEIFYTTFESHHDENYVKENGIQKDDKSLNSDCSTSSFVSAASNHYNALNYATSSTSEISSVVAPHRLDGEKHNVNKAHYKSTQAKNSSLLDQPGLYPKKSFLAASSRLLSAPLTETMRKDEDDRTPIMDETEISYSGSSSSVSSSDQQKIKTGMDFRYSSSSSMSATKSLPLLVAEGYTKAIMRESATLSISPSSSSCYNEYNAFQVGLSTANQVLVQDKHFIKPIPLPPKFSSILNVPPNVTANVKVLDLRGCQHVTDRGLLYLTNNDLSSLEIARFDNCHLLTGRGFSVLTKSPLLHTVSLVNCRRLSDEGIIHLASQSTRMKASCMQELVLDGCRCLTDRSLVAISALAKLSKLDLSQCDLITNEGIDQLKTLTILKSVSFGWCREISDKGIELFTAHPSRSLTLRSIRLARCNKITDVGIGYLSRLDALRELDLNGCNAISSHALGDTMGKLNFLRVLDVSYCSGILRANWQGKINSIRRLNLCYTGVRDIQLSQLMNLSTLEELNLNSCPVGDAAIGHLADNNVAPNLLSLDLADTNLTDLGMSKIVKFTMLTRLSLFYCNITNNSLRHVAKLMNLEVLNLDSRDVSDDGLYHLCGMTKLRSLDVFSGRVTDLGCNHISKITSLESLQLCGGGIGDLGCSILASLDNLKSLNLSQNERITNQGAAALATLTKLRALNLSHTRVSSTGLRLFSGLGNLQSLTIYGCKGADADEQNVILGLQNTLPNLRCLRSERASDFDGRVFARDDSDHDDDDDDDDDDADEDEDDISIERKHEADYFSHVNVDLNDFVDPYEVSLTSSVTASRVTPLNVNMNYRMDEDFDDSTSEFSNHD